jgi:hypothetical protein
MHDGIVHRTFAAEAVLADYDHACIGAQVASFRRVAGCALDVGRRDTSAVQAELLEHEHHPGPIRQHVSASKIMAIGMGEGQTEGRTDDTESFMRCCFPSSHIQAW